MTSKKDKKRYIKEFLADPIIHVKSGQGINDGDIVTVAGIKLYEDGTLTRRCKPGNETMFTARVVT